MQLLQHYKLSTLLRHLAHLILEAGTIIGNVSRIGLLHYSYF